MSETAKRTKVEPATARRIARIQCRMECHPDRSLDDLANWRRGRASEIMKLGATAEELKLIDT